ncbi:sialic acid-binding Ig-like lectin 11 [Pseudochaenichthys georgianus]|uniref:sialic acid-binding Ig-like lectin 11 n=1 Tax=Pseudochaenichthys georgianus TaxID=52239 RepID=UPI00146EE501|nr:sialic acid-binding Ig-like lectin 11 [Pseudochaenichthys georgianus]
MLCVGKLPKTLTLHKREEIEERGEEESGHSRDTQQRSLWRGDSKKQCQVCPVKTDCLKYQIRMFVLICATLLFSVRGIHAETGASVWGRPYCQAGTYCITLGEADITAEAGLCVVIPCSFSTAAAFKTQHIVWYKCKPSNRICGDSDIIFHTNKHNTKVQSLFKGRVSLLQPDVSQGNCSIIINDITESDSGEYQLRVNGLLYGRSDGHTYSERAVLSVKALTQKPSVMIPPLTEGQPTTLTCTAPGLCSGSDPEFTWTWRGAGEKDSQITGNITAFKTENLTAVTQSHSSTLTFNPSAEHHSSSVTCEVGFRNNVTAEETVTLNVTYVKKFNISGNATVKEGETLNLTCSVDSFPPSLIMWTNYRNMQNGSETSLQNGTLTDLQNGTETFLQEERGIGILSILNVTPEDSGLYICTARHMNYSLIEKVNVTVIYTRETLITGDTTVKDGDSLNLTCSVESFPPSLITWTKPGFNTNLNNGPDAYLQSNDGSATLVIPNVTTEYSGQYSCTVQHLDTTVTMYADVTVTWFSRIFNNSECVVHSDILNCVCISEGFPIPTIEWPLLKKHTEYSVFTTVLNHTVNSSLTLKYYSNTSVECVSIHENGEAKKPLTIRINTMEQGDQSKNILKLVSQLEVIIAFFIGLLLSAVLCCFATKCHRNKQKNSGNLEETLGMVASQEDPLIDAGQAAEDYQTYYQEAAEEEGAVAAEKGDTDLNGGPKEVEYASIDFSMLERKSHREAVKRPGTTETEYAEIKKEVKEEKEDNSGEECCMLEEEEAVVMEDEETKHHEHEEEEDVAVYSNVKDIMAES